MCVITLQRPNIFPSQTEVIPAPFDLRVTDVTANSATVSWTPGDSSHHHAIFLNNVEVRVMKPGVFSHSLTGSIAKNISASNFQFAAL